MEDGRLAYAIYREAMPSRDVGPGIRDWSELAEWERRVWATVEREIRSKGPAK